LAGGGAVDGYVGDKGMRSPFPELARWGEGLALPGG
jgi:hypothetical protein